MTKKTIWFQTECGYEVTKDKLLKSGMFSSPGGSKGRFTFRLKEFKDVKFQITKHGKLGIFYPEGISWFDFLERIKPYLVKADGSPAQIGDVFAGSTIKGLSQSKMESIEKKPSHSGFRGWWDRRAEKKRLEKKEWFERNDEEGAWYKYLAFKREDEPELSAEDFALEKPRFIRRYREALKGHDWREDE